MTLYPGDLLLVGLPPEEPLARPGEAVAVEAAGFPSLRFALAAELDLDEGEAAWRAPVSPVPAPSGTPSPPRRGCSCRTAGWWPRTP